LNLDPKVLKKAPVEVVMTWIKSVPENAQHDILMAMRERRTAMVGQSDLIAVKTELREEQDALLLHMDMSPPPTPHGGESVVSEQQSVGEQLGEQIDTECEMVATCIQRSLAATCIQSSVRAFLARRYFFQLQQSHKKAIIRCKGVIQKMLNNCAKTMNTKTTADERKIAADEILNQADYLHQRTQFSKMVRIFVYRAKHTELVGNEEKANKRQKTGKDCNNEKSQQMHDLSLKGYVLDALLRLMIIEKVQVALDNGPKPRKTRANTSGPGPRPPERFVGTKATLSLELAELEIRHSLDAKAVILEHCKQNMPYTKQGVVAAAGLSVQDAVNSVHNMKGPEYLCYELIGEERWQEMHVAKLNWSIDRIKADTPDEHAKAVQRAKNAAKKVPDVLLWWLSKHEYASNVAPESLNDKLA